MDAPKMNRCHAFCDPHMYESVQEIYWFSNIVHYELEVSFCVVRDNVETGSLLLTRMTH